MKQLGPWCWLVQIILCLLFASVISLEVLVRKEHTLTKYGLDPLARNVNGSIVLINRIDQNSPIWMDFDYQHNTAVYIENLSRSSNEEIRLISLNSSKYLGAIKRDVLVGEEMITSLAVDWVTDKLYIAFEASSPRNLGTIEACSLNSFSSSCFLVVNKDLDSLHSLVLDPLEGYMYWLNRVHKRIERAWMNGKHLDKHPFQSDVKEEEISVTTSLTLDSSTKKIFYVRHRANRERAEIMICDVHTRESCRILFENVNAFYLGVVENLVFWTPISTNEGLRFCEMPLCARKQWPIQGTQGLNSFELIDQSIQPHRPNNPCELRNGGCSHHCLLIPGVPWRSCACPVGVRLLEDGLNCDIHGIQNLLLVGSEAGLFHISLDTEEFVPKRMVWTNGKKEDSQRIVSIDFHHQQRKVYWLDKESNQIRKAGLDDQEYQELPISAEKVKFIDGIVVDSTNNNLLWLDSFHGRIELVRLRENAEGYHSKVIMSKELFHPKSLVLSQNHLYFVNYWNGEERIERSWIDGSHRTILYRNPAPSFISALLVDPSENVIYFTDKEKSTLLSMDLNGGEERIIAEDLKHPYQLTKFGPNIFMNSLAGRSIIRLRMFEDRVKRSELAQSIYGQMSLKAVNLQATHRLLNETCRECEHICLGFPNKVMKCVCGDGYELAADQRSCTRIKSFILLSSDNHGLSRLSIRQSEANLSLFPLQGSGNIKSLTIDTRRGLLYMISDNAEKGNSNFYLTAFDLNTNQGRVIMQWRDLRFISKMILDEDTQNIFWVNNLSKRIEVLNTRNHIRLSLIWKEIEPADITIDFQSNVLLYTNSYGNRHRIVKMYLNNPLSSSVTVIEVSKPVVTLSLETKTGVIVFSMANKVYSIGLNGQGLTELFESTSSVDTMSLHQSSIYFYNNLDKTVKKYDIAQKKIEVLHKDLHHVNSLLAVDLTALKQFKIDGLVQCELEAESKNCICLKEKTKYDCKCGDQYEYDDITDECVEPSRFVLLSVKDRFLRFKLPHETNSAGINDNTTPFTVLSIDNIGQPLAISFDLYSKNRYIYWIDGFDRNGADLKRSSDMVRQHQTSHLSLHKDSNCTQLFDVVVDYIGRQLFVSCNHDRNDAAGYVHLWKIQEDDQLLYIGQIVDGSKKSTVTRLLPSPRKIAVFNRLKTFFYTDENPELEHPIIVRCNLDGRNCQPSITEGLNFHQIKLQSDLTTYSLIYTTEDGIWSKDVYADHDVNHHLKTRSHHNPVQISSVAPLNDKTIIFSASSHSKYDENVYILYKNQSTKSFDTMETVDWFQHLDLFGRRKMNLLTVGNLNTLSGPLEWEFNTNPCSSQSCSHICTLQYNQIHENRWSYECLCPLGFSKVNGNKNLCEANVNCKHWEFACHNGQQCVHISKKCDDWSDCSDQSDESPLRCNAKRSSNISLNWVCDDRQGTIKKHKLCDGHFDCFDRSDEAYCRCSEPLKLFDCMLYTHSEHTPTEDRCISRSLLCDRRNNCMNGVDETKQLCNLLTLDFESSSLLEIISQGKRSLMFMLAGIVVLVFLLLCIVCFVCKREWHQYSQRETSQVLLASPQQHTEAKLVIPHHNHGTSMVEVALRTFTPQVGEYPMYASTVQSCTLRPYQRSSPKTSLHYRTLPRYLPAHVTHTSDVEPVYYGVRSGAGEDLATMIPPSASSRVSSGLLPPPPFSYDRRFYAPPPSAASLSTYGIVKPIDVGPTYVPVSSREAHTSTSSRPQRLKRKTRRKNPKTNKEAPGNERDPPPPYSSSTNEG